MTLSCRTGPASVSEFGQSGAVRRRLLLIGALVLVGIGGFIAWDQPRPDSADRWVGNPCDGSIVAAFYIDDPRAPERSDCRGPARRQLAVSSVLLMASLTLLVVRSRTSAEAVGAPHLPN